MGKLHGVAHGIDVGGRRAHKPVDHDAARLARPDAGRHGQRRLGAHAHREQHDVGRERAARAQAHPQRVAVGLERFDGLAQIEPHAPGRELLVHEGGHREVERRHDLVAHFDHAHGRARGVQVFGHLQADETAAHHDGVPHRAAVHPGLDAVGVGHVAQRKHTRQVGPRQGRPHGRGPRRQQQFVVALGGGGAVGRAHADGLCRRVDGHDLAARTHVDGKAAAEGLGRLHEQAVAPGYGAADVIGQAAVGIRDVFAALEHHDFRTFVHAAQTGGSRGSSGHAAYDDILHGFIHFVLIIFLWKHLQMYKQALERANAFSFFKDGGPSRPAPRPC